VAPGGAAGRVRAHDSPEKGAQNTVPYGVDDLAADAGWVSVGCDGDTAAVAVATLRRWWNGEGRHRDPAATRLLICADAGGANGSRVRAWQQELAGFAHASGLQVTVCHLPPGTSEVEQDRAPAVLPDQQQLARPPADQSRGRRRHDRRHHHPHRAHRPRRTRPRRLPTGVTIPDEVMVALPLTAHDRHGTWNYTLRPEPPAPLPVPRYHDRTQPADRAPDWLHHPALTGMDTRAFADLLAAVEQYLLDHPPISLHHKRARHRILRRGPLSLSDRLLVTVLRHRWKTQIRALTSLLGSPANAVGDALHEMTPILEALDRRIRQAPITAPTTADLANLIGRTHTKKGK
jgi:hypothetical protein